MILKMKNKAQNLKLFPLIIININQYQGQEVEIEEEMIYININIMKKIKTNIDMKEDIMMNHIIKNMIINIETNINKYLLSNMLYFTFYQISMIYYSLLIY